jgi:hypothetical protein
MPQLTLVSLVTTFVLFVVKKKKLNHKGTQRKSRRAQRAGNIFILILLLICFGALLNSSSGQTLNYAEIFSDDWKKAEQFVADNEKWIRPVLEKYKVDYYEAISVVFPELVRYSALRDKMEITLLKALYINLGKDYANFSIGQFQMKPSFAEIIVDEGRNLTGRRKPVIRDSTDYEDIRSFRAAIVSSLEDIHSQLDYLVIFFKITGKQFDLKKMDDLSRIRFLATAYNYGPMYSEKEIMDMSARKFYSTKLAGKERWSYADISVYWYINVPAKIKEK